MSVTVIIATYGDHEWNRMAWDRAHASVPQGQECYVIHCDECTIAQARNSAARWGSGDWLCFLDADDELAPGYLSAMKRAYEQWRARGGNAPDDGTPPLLTPAVSYVRKGKPSPPQFNDRGIPLSQDNWLVVGTLIRRDLFERIGGFHEAPHGFEDFGCWSKAWRAGAKIVKVPDAVYLAHVNPRSKHKIGWRNRKWQVATHERVIAELDEWERNFKAVAA